MLRILIVAEKPTFLVDFAAFLLKSNGTEVYRSVSGEEAFKVIGRETINAVVVDALPDEGASLSFVRQVTKLQPLINCAMVSSLAQEDFHEATEGLGIFMQLPVAAGAKEAELMLQMLETIEVLMTL